MNILRALFAAFAVFSLSFALPTGASSVSAGTPVSLGTQAPGTADAWGGNITQLNLSINSSTLHWQGFYGSISASLRLASGDEGSVNTLKTWNVSNVSGQIYVSQSSNVDFTLLNSTPATLSNVDSAFAFLSGANDAAVNTGTNSANPEFNVGQYAVSANSYPLISTYDNLGNPVWKQVVMRHASSGTPSDFVFVGILNSSGIAFNGNPAHFQIIVPENSAGDTSVTTYYFYGEIQ